MYRFCLAVALAVLLPVGARAEPVTIELQSSSGATQTGAPSLGWFLLDLGEVQFTGPDSSAIFFIDGQHHGSD